MTNPKNRVVAVLNDLMFTVKIQDAAKRAGLDVVFVKSHEDALVKAKENAAIIILDLNTSAVEPLNMIAAFKNDADTSKIDLLGYISHVQVDLKLAAQEKGCDMVVARSAFSQNLPAILKRYVA